MSLFGTSPAGANTTTAATAAMGCKAGKMTLAGKRVTADPRRGHISIAPVGVLFCFVFVFFFFFFFFLFFLAVFFVSLWLADGVS